MKHQLFWGWLCVSSLIAFLLFGYDKLRASRFPERRVSEFHLLLIGAVGGWPGGLLGMLLFRHKTAKLSFKFKYAFSFVVWACLLWAAWRFFRD
jgi:uncharacterized membrane protein YsdA (DUF1294 family)